LIKALSLSKFATRWQYTRFC